MESKRVLLIGGSGFLGGWIAARLIQGGLRVVVPTRRRDGCKWVSSQPEADLLVADVHDPHTLASLMTGVDAVINLVGILHDRNTTPPFGRLFSAAHVELPRKILAAMRQAGVRRLVHVSAMGADACAPSAYLRSKAAGEALVKAAADAIDVTIFRPSVIFGANDAFLNLFAGLLRVFPVFPLACATARFQPVFVGDVAAAVADSLSRTETFGQVYELGGPKVYTLRELVAYTAACIGKRRFIVGLPAPLAYIQASVLGLLPNPPMSPDNLRSMQVPNVSDGRHDYPGWRPATLESIVPDYLA